MFIQTSYFTQQEIAKEARYKGTLKVYITDEDIHAEIDARKKLMGKKEKLGCLKFFSKSKKQSIFHHLCGGQDYEVLSC